MGKVSAAILINEKKELLLYLRDNKKTIPYPNTWALIGGHIEAKETPIEALKRETMEEINCSLKNIIFLDSFDDAVGNLVYVYKSKIDKKKEEIKLNEGQELNFFSFNDCLKLNIPAPMKKFLVKNMDKILEDF